MKILYITTAYTLKNSSAAIRNNALVKGLIQIGHEVDVVTIKWPQDLHSDYLNDQCNGKIHYVELNNLKLISNVKKSVLKSFLSMKLIRRTKECIKRILFFPDECYQFIKAVDYTKFAQYDNLITSSDHKSSHYVGLNLKQKFPDIRWIQIWGDPWKADVNTPWMLRYKYGRGEKKLLSQADQIVYVSSVTRDDIANKYQSISYKLNYIPRGFYDRVNCRGIINNPTIITYTGILSFGRNIENLLKAITNQTLNKVEVHTYGPKSEYIEALAKQYPCLKNHDSVSQEELVAIYKHSSMLLYISNAKGSTQIPGKLYDYMGTTLPILCLVEDSTDATSDFLSNHDRCYLIENRFLEIKDQFAEIIEFSKKKFEIDETYSPEVIAKEISSLFAKA